MGRPAALGRWYCGADTPTPEMNVHVDGTPDVPDIVHPGDWIDDGWSCGLVIKMTRHQGTELDYCPEAWSWTIRVLGIGYLRERKVSIHDCGWINQIVAVDGKLLQLYKLGWNEKEIKIVQKPSYAPELSMRVKALIRRENPPVQLSFI